MRIVTSGSAYIDIDAYGGCIAYAELLRLQGVEAVAVSTAPLNESISETVRNWDTQFQTDYIQSEKDSFTLIDVSDLKYFDKLVNIDRVDEIIDHHPGFENYWTLRIGENSQIDFIGAACTLVFERWKMSGLLGEMSINSARLLICGILDNTLNFGAKVTIPRDIVAYDTLLTCADLPENWTAQYFTECQTAILKDVNAAIQNDTKILKFKSFDQPICFGQLTVWDGKQLINEYASAIRNTLSAIKPQWFMNIISVSEHKSYFYTGNATVQEWLSTLLGVRFDGLVAVADHLWLRKEVIKQDIDSTTKIQRS